MSQKRYAVIGHPIGHTMSPFIHKRLFEMRDIDADYGVYDIPTEDLIGKIQELKSLDGFNITIPHKQAIIPFLKQMDQKASLYPVSYTHLFQKHPSAFLYLTNL